MHRWPQDLSTILGISIVCGCLVGVFVGKIGERTLDTALGFAGPLIVISQRRTATVVQTSTATINAQTPPVIQTQIAPSTVR